MLIASRFEDKVLLEEIGIVKMDTTPECVGMVPPLSHAPNGWDSHRERECFLMKFRGHFTYLSTWAII
jgi:hypothetical protein